MSSPPDPKDAANGVPHEPANRRDLTPSQAYKEATGYPVYRLSELMFGSLLAAYVLGFLGAAQGLMLPQSVGQTVAQVSAPWDWMQLVGRHLTYLFISVSYAFVTAGIYISYHAGMLTLPPMPLPRLSWDFLVAILQAIGFGYSLLAPQWFPVVLGLAMLVVFWRQWREFVSLANYLDKRYGPSKERGREHDVKEFRLGLHRLLKNEEVLSGWNRVGAGVAIGIGVACLVFAAAWSCELYYDVIKQPYQDYCVTAQTIILGLFVIVRSHGVLKARASFLEASEDDGLAASEDGTTIIAMDEAYKRLTQALSQQEWRKKKK